MSDDKWDCPGYFGEEPASLRADLPLRWGEPVAPTVSMVLPWYGGESPLKAGDVLRVESVGQSATSISLLMSLVERQEPDPKDAAPARETADCQTAGAVSRAIETD